MINLKKRLRDPLEFGEKVLVLAERLFKKDAPGRLYESITENKTFFNRDRVFTIRDRSRLKNNTYLYRLKEDSQRIKNRFLRQEICALKN